MDKYKQLCNKLFGSSQAKGFRSYTSLTSQDIDPHFFKKIAAILDIKMRLTSYVARYTIGKVLMENEIDPLVIQKMYDHESFKTTPGYWEAIQQNRVDAAGAFLSKLYSSMMAFRYFFIVKLLDTVIVTIRQ